MAEHSADYSTDHGTRRPGDHKAGAGPECCTDGVRV
jgi:hypothetical protein